MLVPRKYIALSGILHTDPQGSSLLTMHLARLKPVAMKSEADTRPGWPLRRVAASLPPPVFRPMLDVPERKIDKKRMETSHLEF